jgi:lysophospholipase L1-like esterase
MCKRRRAYLAFIGNSFIARTEPYERRSELYAINDSRYAAYQAPVRAVAKAIGAPYIELHDSMVEAAKTQQIICDDGVHPSALGHELMDKLVWDSGVIQDFYSATRPPKNTALPEDFALPQVGLVA